MVTAHLSLNPTIGVNLSVIWICSLPCVVAALVFSTFVVIAKAKRSIDGNHLCLWSQCRLKWWRGIYLWVGLDTRGC